MKWHLMTDSHCLFIYTHALLLMAVIFVQLYYIIFMSFCFYFYKKNLIYSFCHSFSADLNWDLLSSHLHEKSTSYFTPLVLSLNFTSLVAFLPQIVLQDASTLLAPRQTLETSNPLHQRPSSSESHWTRNFHEISSRTECYVTFILRHIKKDGLAIVLCAFFVRLLYSFYIPVAVTSSREK